MGFGQEPHRAVLPADDPTPSVAQWSRFETFMGSVSVGSGHVPSTGLPGSSLHPYRSARTPCRFKRRRVRVVHEFRRRNMKAMTAHGICGQRGWGLTWSEPEDEDLPASNAICRESAGSPG